jgi:hypothetical protein
MPKDMRPAPQRDVDIERLNKNINDKSLAMDRTGVMFQGVPHQQNEIKRFFLQITKPAQLRCPDCKSDRFMIFTSQVDEQVQFRCGNQSCRLWWKPVGLHKPQMTDAIAKSLGLWLPPVVHDAMYQDLEGWEDGSFNDLVDEQTR